jgi:uncharacterized protein (UPF0548 family)
VRVLTARMARLSAFDCEEWSRLSINCTRQDLSRGAFVHDLYEAEFIGDFNRATDALFSYRIFAPRRMYARVCTRDGQVAEGATIVQRAILGPLAIETAVRVVEVERSSDRAFFAYATLAGHPERGIASFAVLRTDGTLKFEAEAWSRAGNLGSLLARPVARALQRALTREAIASFVTSAGQ